MTQLLMPTCWPCVVGLHEECPNPQLVTDLQDAMLDAEVPMEHIPMPWTTCCCKANKTADAQDFVNGVGRPVLDPSDITDVLSTGRKRAQMLYPITEGMQCEWAFLASAGGGIEPIVGCRGNTINQTKEGPHAGHRHHGPNKNTIENSPLNVHRICTFCHNRWHALNNRYYGERPAADQPYLPVVPEGMVLQRHDPDTIATEEQLEESEAFWSGQKLEKIDVED
jgi:hypothetical protein